MKKLYMLLACFFIMVITGCSSGGSDTPAPLSSAKSITAFDFTSPAEVVTITEVTHSIAIKVPFDTVVTALVPTITHTGASISPASGVAHDFTSSVTYTVTAADSSTQAYTVRVDREGDYSSASIGTLKHVPAGTFQRDGTGTNVSTVWAFRMSEKEITRAEFTTVTGLPDPSQTSASTGTDNPVQRVNWYHALVFCNKLSILEVLTPVYTINDSTDPDDWGAVPTTSNAIWDAAIADWNADGYRLPTEMEWMWAAMGATSDGRAGDIVGGVNTGGYTKGYAGSTEVLAGIVNIGNYAWYLDPGTTHPVGTKTQNELGLYDMSGNVWEWCWDWYDTYPTGAQLDYKGTASGTKRSLRGASVAEFPSSERIANRIGYNPYEDLWSNFGFRVVRN